MERYLPIRKVYGREVLDSRGNPTVEAQVTLTDGTVIDLSNAGGSIGPEDGVTVCSKGEVFSEVLPMEDMASISVGGVVYDLTVE